jgi:hypothetical protein
MLDFTEYKWSDWETKFKPVKNHFRKDPDEIMFETYGEELDYVFSVEPNTVWTYVQGDTSMIIVAGYHYVNRIGYYITEVPWTNEDDCVLVSEDVECECYNEDGYENGEYGKEDCPECEGSGYVTKYND